MPTPPKTTRKKPPPKKVSHQFKLRIKMELYEKFEDAAAKRGVSLASIMISATAKELGLA